MCVTLVASTTKESDMSGYSNGITGSIFDPGMIAKRIKMAGPTFSETAL